MHPLGLFIYDEKYEGSILALTGSAPFLVQNLATATVLLKVPRGRPHILDLTPVRCQDTLQLPKCMNGYLFCLLLHKKSTNSSIHLR